MILLKQMLIFFVMMIIGYYLARKDIIDDRTSKKLSWIVINVANPALIISGSLSETTISVQDILYTTILAFAIFFALILFAELILPLLRFPKEEIGIYKSMLVFSNMGFMGFPIIAALYGNVGLMYASTFLIPFNLLIYTYGIVRITGENKKNEKNAKENLKNIVNIGVLACVVSFVISIFKVPMPGMAVNTIGMLSNLTAPLSMMIIGASFIHINFKKLITAKKILLFSFIRLLIVPLIGLSIIKLVIDDPVICGICLVVLATPVANMTVMLSQQYGDNVEVATEGVALTTLFSILTIPLLFSILGL